MVPCKLQYYILHGIKAGYVKPLIYQYYKGVVVFNEFVFNIFEIVFYFRVMVQVSCEVTAPNQARPSEGILFVNVELSPMAAPQFEAGRYTPRILIYFIHDDLK